MEEPQRPPSPVLDSVTPAATSTTASDSAPVWPVDLKQGAHSIFIIKRDADMVAYAHTLEEAQFALDAFATAYEKQLDRNVYMVFRTTESEDCIMISTQKKGMIWNSGLRPKATFTFVQVPEVVIQTTKFGKIASPLVTLPPPLI